MSSLVCSIKSLPLGVFYAMQLKKLSIALTIVADAQDPVLTTADGRKVTGELEIIVEIAPELTAAPADDAVAPVVFYGGDAVSAADLALASALITKTGANLADVRASKDLVAWATAAGVPAHLVEWLVRVMSAVAFKMALGFAMSQATRFTNAAAKTARATAAAAAAAAAKPAAAAAKPAAKAVTVDEPELPGAVPGAVHVRFAPEPSGFMHIGHTKAVLLNKFFAEKYGGTFRLRFDDTNPRVESQEFEDSIRNDLHRLGVHPNFESRTSDHFDWFLEITERLIEDGSAYLYGADSDTMRDERANCVESAYRSTTPAENLALWRRLCALAPEVDADTEIQGYCVRIKIDMSSDNGCLRDPVIWRYVDCPHHHLGARWPRKVYPTYDFACPLVDAKEGVTWALRSLEFMDRDVQYAHIVRIVGESQQRRGETPLVASRVYDFSRMNLQYCVLSKRHLRRLVAANCVESWTDPRFPTIQGLIRRGITPSALERFVVIAGASRAANNQEWCHLWSMNREVIDATAPRHFAVISQKTAGQPSTVIRAPVELTLTGEVNRTVLVDARDVDLLTTYDETKQSKKCRTGVITLMTLGNAKVTSLSPFTAEAVFESDRVYAGTTKLSWVDAAATVPVSLRYFDHLVVTPALPAKTTGDQLANIVNKSTLHEYRALVAREIADAEVGSFVQLQRIGYFRVDAAATETEPAVLVNVPEGSLRPQGLAPIFFDDKEAQTGRDFAVREGMSIPE